MRSKNALRNIIFYFIFEIIALACGVVFPRFIISIYGSEINGLTSTITRLLSLIGLIQASAVGAAIFQMYKPVATDDFYTQSLIINSSKKFYKKVSIIYLAASLVIAIAYSFYLSKENLGFFDVFLPFLILAINGTNVLLFNSVCDILLSSYQKRYLISIASIAEQLVRYFLLIVVLLLRLHFICIYFCYLAGGIVSIAINLFFYFKNSKGRITKDYDRYFQIKNKKYLMISTIGSEAVTASPVVIITTFVNLIASSIFSIYSMIFVSMKTILSSIQLSFTAIFGYLSKTASNEHLFKIHSCVELLTFLMGTICSSCVGFLIIPFMKLYSRGISDANYVNVLLGFFVVVYTLVFAFRASFGYLSTVYGLFKDTCYITITFGFFGIVTSIVCVLLFGMPFVMIGLLLNQVCCSVTTLFIIKRKVPWFRINKLFYRLLIMTLITSCALVLSYYFNDFIDSWMRWVACACIIALGSALVFSLYCILFDRESFFLLFKYAKQIVKRTHQ